LARLGTCAGTAAGLGLGVWGFFLDPVTPSSIEPAVETTFPVIVTAVLTVVGLSGGLLLGGLAAALLCRGKPVRQDALLHSMEESARLHWQRPAGLGETGLHPHGWVQEAEAGQ
jgi:hypothetical protein